MIYFDIHLVEFALMIPCKVILYANLWTAFNTIKMALKASMREDVMRVILKMVPECLCGRLGFEEHMSLMHIKIAVRIIKVSWKNALDKNKAIFIFKTKQPKESTYVSCI